MRMGGSWRGCTTMSCSAEELLATLMIIYKGVILDNLHNTLGGSSRQHNCPICPEPPSVYSDFGAFAENLEHRWRSILWMFDWWLSECRTAINCLSKFLPTPYIVGKKWDHRILDPLIFSGKIRKNRKKLGKILCR